MADVRRLWMHIEFYVKNRVDFKTLDRLSPESYEKFLTRAAIEISRETFPAKVFGISRDELREMVRDVIVDIRAEKRVRPTADKVYSYINSIGETIVVYAKTKKEAGELMGLASYVNPLYWGKKSTIKRILQVYEGGRAELDNGEYRQIPHSGQFINLYGHGGVASA
jgi:hypothetical protein